MERFLLVTFFMTVMFGLISASNGTEDKFKEDVLLYHNRFRKRHNVPPLKLNTTLSEMAGNWASKVAENDEIRPSSISNSTADIGESLCMECGFDFNGYNVTLEWYRQACNYNFTTHQNIFNVGEIKNFQRMVWKSATEFGIGRAKSKHLPVRCSYIVAWYNPIKGSAKDNVFPGGFCGQECPKKGKNPEGGKYLHDKGPGVFLCGGSAEVLRKKACEHFGCENGLFVRQKAAQ